MYIGIGSCQKHWKTQWIMACLISRAWTSFRSTFGIQENLPKNPRVNLKHALHAEPAIGFKWPIPFAPTKPDKVWQWFLGVGVNQFGVWKLMMGRNHPLDIQPYLLRFGVWLVFSGGPSPNATFSAGGPGCLGIMKRLWSFQSIWAIYYKAT